MGIDGLVAIKGKYGICSNCSIQEVNLTAECPFYRGEVKVNDVEPGDLFWRKGERENLLEEREVQEN